MKYICTIEINAPIEKLIELWADEQYFDQWQDGFQSIDHFEGEPHSKGAKSKIILDDNRRIELIETILINKLPFEKTALYEHKHMTNTQTTRFEPISNQRTLYISEVEYIKFNGLFIRLIAKLFPNKFKNQSQKWMNQFKVFAENKLSSSLL